MLIALGISDMADWPRISDVPGMIPLGVVLIIIGVALSVSAAFLFRREGTELNPTSITNRKLVTSGPFSFTRNPMYLGLVLVTLGIAFCAGVWPMFLAPVATFATANWAHIPFEEAKMRRQFGADFEAYTSKVRRWI
ncbi:MAG TPA: isoprenylcysteine carboxylmethyltransferase family protein [Rhodopila sp.]